MVCTVAQARLLTRACYHGKIEKKSETVTSISYSLISRTALTAFCNDPYDTAELDLIYLNLPTSLLLLPLQSHKTSKPTRSGE